MPNLNTRAVSMGVVAVGVVLLAAVVLVGAGVIGPFGLGRTEFASAVAGAPAGTERVSWTDWAGVRRELDSASTHGRAREDLEAFLDDGYDADLTSRSALLQSAAVLQTSFGFSPASVEWELFSQSRDGAVITLRLPDDTDFTGLGDRLEELGYPRPDSATGVWAGGPDLLSSISPGLTPELAHLVLDADENLVLASDQERFLETAVRATTGDGDRVNGLDAVVDALEEPLSAAVYTGDYACAALAMAQADDDDQAQAAELTAAAGNRGPVPRLLHGRPVGRRRPRRHAVRERRPGPRQRRQPGHPGGRPSGGPGGRLRRPLHPALRPSRRIAGHARRCDRPKVSTCSAT